MNDSTCILTKPTFSVGNTCANFDFEFSMGDESYLVGR